MSKHLYGLLKQLKACGAAPSRMLVGGMALLAFPAAGHGQATSDPPRDSVFALEGLVVGATRTAARVGDIPAHISIVTREDVQTSGFQTLPDLLQSIPGYATLDNQSSIVAHPSLQAPGLRGLGGSSAGRALVMVDGVPVSEPFTGWMHWARIPMEFVERVEVVRGGGSGVWGNRALGGLINIVTLSGDRTGVDASLQGGSHGMLRGSGAVRMAGERNSFIVGGELFGTDGYRTIRPDLRGPIDTPVTSDHRVVFAALRADLSDRLEVRAGGTFLDEDRDNGTPLRVVATELWDVRSSLRYRGEGAGEWGLTAFGGSSDFSQVFSSEALDRSSESLALDQFDIPANQVGAQVSWLKRLGAGHELSLGADVLRIDGEVNEDFLLIANALTRRRRVGGQQFLVGAYLQDHWRIDQHWGLITGVRVDRWENRDGSRFIVDLRNDSTLTDQASIGRSETDVSYSVGLRYAGDAGMSWRGSAYSAFRAPTLNELLKPFQAPGNVVVESNDGLVAEHLFGVESGVDVSLGGDALGRFTIFWNRVRDPILEVTLELAGANSRFIAPCGFVRAGGSCGQRQNIGSARSAGLEAELEVRPAPYWTLSGFYTFKSTRVLEATVQPELVGKSLRGSANHEGTFTLRHANPRLLDLSATGRFVGARFGDDLNTLELDSHAVLDLRAARPIRPGIEVSMALLNVFDTEFETTRAASGLVRVGMPRTFTAGVRVRR